MKEFDLKLAKAGKPICTRDGKEAKIICFDAKREGYPIIALVDYTTTEEVYFYTSKGSLYPPPTKPYGLDLMMISEKYKGWVNVYRDSDRNPYTDKLIFNTEEAAIFEGVKAKNYITTIEVEWEE